ncbi:MAG: response regulator transcription factor [Halopseudomonas sp.]
MLHIAVLESDRYLAETIMGWLEQAGHRYTCCSQPAEFLACLSQQPFDLLLLDCACADRACFELIEQGLACQSERIPLLYVAEPGAEADIVRALEHGADDYVVKPLKPDALLPRIQVLVRRFGSQAKEQLPEVQQFGLFTIDRKQRAVSRSGEAVVLTDKDYCLADYLFTHQNQLLSRHRLLTEVWGVSQQVNTRTVDMHISRLRKALLLEGTGYEIQTVHQHGYRLQNIE